MTQYIAFIDTDNGESVTVGVNEADLVGERPEGFDDDGNAIYVPEYAMGPTVAMAEVSTGIAQNDEDKLARVEAAARDILSDAGWHIVGDWEIADNAYYATVERY